MLLKSQPGAEYPPYRCTCPSTKPTKCPACQKWECKSTRYQRPSGGTGSPNYHKPPGVRPKALVGHLIANHTRIQEAIQSGVPYSILARQYQIGPHPFIKYCKETGIYQSRHFPRLPD